MHFFTSAAVAASLLVAPSGLAQEVVYNVKFSPSSGPLSLSSSSPADFVEIGGRLYFSAGFGGKGRELIALDVAAGEPALFFDANWGASSGEPTRVLELPDGRFVFGAESNNRVGLYASDGSTEGTTNIAEFLSFYSTSYMSDPILHQGEAWFFMSDDTTNERGVWKSDGTAAGTVRVADLLNPWIEPTDGEHMVSAGSTLYFTDEGSIPAGSVWRLNRIDGPSDTVTQVIEVLGGSSGDVGVDELSAVGSTLVLSARSANLGDELWLSDGTQFGTFPVDLAPGGPSSDPRELTALGGVVYFTAQDPAEGREVFRTDGTPGGTYRVTAAHPGIGGDGPTNLASALGRLFFSVNDFVVGEELWSTDGTVGGEGLWADFAPGLESSYPMAVHEFGGAVLCAAGGAATGAELYRSDGTPAGTWLVADIEPGADGSSPTRFTTFDGVALFAATTGNFVGEELWRTDGTAEGTELLANLADPPDGDSDPIGLASVGDRLVFFARESNSYELWASDGSEAGTESIAPTDIGFGGVDILSHAGRAWFGYDGVGGNGLWVTDGTSAGTEFAAALGAPVPLRSWRGLLFFIATSFSGRDLWALDHTGAAYLVANTDAIGGAGDALTSDLVEVEDWFYFSAYAVSEPRLYRTQGDPLATTLPTVGQVTPNVDYTTEPAVLHGGALGGRLYFGGRPSSGGDFELWRTNEAGDDASLWMDLNPTGESSPRDFIELGDRLFFKANVGFNEYHLFVTDGTTVLQLTETALPHLFPQPLATNGEVVFFWRSAELWVSDGTVEGTQFLVDHGLSYDRWKPTSGNQILLELDDGEPFNGYRDELWVSDGTPAGTFRLTDTMMGVEEVVRVGSALYFEADTGPMGHEVHTLPIAAFGGWVAESFGAGCPGSSGLAPTVAATGLGRIGGLLTVRTEGAAPNAPLATYFALDYGLGDVGGCATYLASPTLLLLGATDGLGSSEFDLPIPNDPVLAGLAVWFQTVVADAGGALSGVGALTPALEVIVGG